MEENNITPQTEPSGSNLMITDISKYYLTETAQWTQFLSIVGFVGTGLIIVLSFFIGSIFSSMPFPGGEMSNMPKGFGFIFGVIYFLIGVLYFFPSWYLYNFTRKMKTALTKNDSEALEVALSNQKSFYKFWGILMIVLLGFYGLVAIVSLSGLLLQ